MEDIKGFFNEYRFLSNFWECPVTYEERTYQSSEAAYQAAKCKREEDKDRFTRLTASISKKVGRNVDMREDWDKIKLMVMHDIVDAKFRQNSDLREKLLATKDTYLEETNTWNDTFWGVCRGKGTNHLGIILMQTRNILSEGTTSLFPQE